MTEIGISTIIETIWQTFRDRLASEVTTVTIDDKGVSNAKTVTIQSYMAAMSNTVLDSKSDYPIMVINSPSIESEYYTGKRDQMNCSITIDIYTTNAPSADKFMSKIYSSIETYKGSLNALGIQQVHVSDSDSDSAQRESFTAHVRSLTFTFKTYFDKTW